MACQGADGVGPGVVHVEHHRAPRAFHAPRVEIHLARRDSEAQDDFLALGLMLKAFYIENLKPSSKSAEELRAMGMLDMQTYTQLQAADAMRDAAQNPSGGAGLTAGIGAGLGVGNVLSQSLAGMVGAGAAQPPVQRIGRFFG